MLEARVQPTGQDFPFTPEWYADREAAPHLEEAPHQARLMAAARFVQELANCGETWATDFGCGDGGLLSLISEYVRADGVDITPANVEAARRRGVRASCVDFTKLPELVPDPLEERGGIAICTEVLEHLDDPHGLVRWLGTRYRYLVASSPADETPEWHDGLHAWTWDMEGYAAMIEGAGFTVLKHERVPPMFQVVLGVAK